MIFLSLLLLLLYSCSSKINLTLTKTIGFNTANGNLLAFCDFNVNQAIVNYISLESLIIAVVKSTSIFRNGTQISNKYLSYNNIKLSSHPTNTATNSRYFGIDTNDILRCYQYNNLTLTYTSSTAILDVAFLSVNTQLVYITNSTKIVYKLNLLNNSIINNVSLGTKKPQQIHFTGGYIVIYSQDASNSSKGYISLYDQNLILFKQITGKFRPITETTIVLTTFTFKHNHTIQISSNKAYLIQTYGTTIDIWNLTTGVIIKTFKQSSTVYQGFICLDFLVTLLNGTVRFYQTGTWTYLTQISYSFGLYNAHMKCFENDSIIGVESPKLNANIQFIKMNYTLSISTNITNLTNTTQFSTNNSIIISNNLTKNISYNSSAINSTTPNNTNGIFNNNNTNNSTSNFQNGTTFQNLNQTKFQQLARQYYPSLSQYISKIFNNQDVNKTTVVLAQIASISSATNIASSVMRPMATLFQEFMFYMYHVKTYPQIVQAFSCQFDILTFLRIKPSFLNFSISSQELQYQNSFYLNQSQFIYDRAPDHIYFILNFTNLYLFNILLVGINYIILFIIAKFTKFIGFKYKILQSINQFFQMRTVWWNLLVMSIQFNIRTLSFYIFSQLAVPFSLNLGNKVNFILVVIVLTIILFYTFTFYFLLYKLQKSNISKEIMDIKDYKLPAYTKQMVLNCMRGFMQGFMHGTLTGYHNFQIIGLIFVDIFSIVFIIFYRKDFNNVIKLLLIGLYVVLFLAFNIFLGFYSFDTFLNFDYQFTFMIIIIMLSATTVLRMLAGIVQLLFEICKKFCQKNKIKNSKFQKQNVDQHTQNIETNTSKSVKQKNNQQVKNYQPNLNPKKTKKSKDQKNIIIQDLADTNNSLKLTNKNKIQKLTRNTNNKKQIFTNKKEMNLPIKKKNSNSEYIGNSNNNSHINGFKKKLNLYIFKKKIINEHNKNFEFNTQTMNYF